MSQRIAVFLLALVLLLAYGPSPGQFSAGSTALATDQPAAQSKSEYPQRPIELWVGFSAGSGTDTHARILAPCLEKELGQSIVVINKPGAGGVVMWTELARAKPDGYTLGIINLPALAAAAATTDLEFDPLQDITYIGNASGDAVTLAVNAEGRYKTLDDLIEYARQNPGKVIVGVTGKASQDFLTARAVEKAAGVEFTYVNFEGTSEGINAILGNHIDVMGMSLSSAEQFYESGQLGLLGVGVDERLPDFPDVPTFKEQGVELFGGGALNYKALGGPGGLPPDIRDTVAEALKRCVANPEYIAKVESIGSMPHYLSPNELEELAQKHVTIVKDFLSEPGSAATPSAG